ncbi:thioredoxin TrxA [Paraferrimonas sp. SM1919]|uniref:thioredoxin TrxA n=1 Tax=Paraferrimonas sp. SM1919 TaxID=2662263 RepID=UPI0013D1AC93
MSDLILHLNDANFEETVNSSELPVLVDFWAQWCGPCKMIAPILDEIAADNQGKVVVAKVDVDDNREAPAKFGVRGIPTLVLLKNGEKIATQVGAASKTDLQKLIDENL